jgi:hypothetical protein
VILIEMPKLTGDDITKLTEQNKNDLFSLDIPAQWKKIKYFKHHKYYNLWKTLYIHDTLYQIINKFQNIKNGEDYRINKTKQLTYKIYQCGIPDYYSYMNILSKDTIFVVVNNQIEDLIDLCKTTISQFIKNNNTDFHKCIKINYYLNNFYNLINYIEKNSEIYIDDGYYGYGSREAYQDALIESDTLMGY